MRPPNPSFQVRLREKWAAQTAQQSPLPQRSKPAQTSRHLPVQPQRAHTFARLLALFFLPLGLLAQQPASSTRPVAVPKSTPDEPLQFTFAPTPELSEHDADTLPDSRFRQYDPARRRTVDWGTLGNLGASARPLFFEIAPRRGFDVGIHNFDLYRIAPQELRFYRNANAFTEVGYSRGRSQDDGEFSAKFARTFAGGMNFSLEYRNIKNLGQYRYQNTKHNALAFGGWLPVGKRYEAFLVFAKNTLKQQENGGITSADAFGGDNVGGAIDIPVWLDDNKALTRQGTQDLQLTQHLKIAGAAQTDSTGREIADSRRALRLTHTLTWGKETYKYAHGDVPATDAVFYGDFFTDARGLRHYLELRRLENAVMLTTFKPKGAGRRSDFLAAGLSHTYFDVAQEPETQRFSNLFLTGNAAFTPSERFNFEVRGDLGLLENGGEYRLEGRLKLGLGAAGELRGQLLSQRRPPALVAERLFVSKQAVWSNDFAKPVENSLSATYALPHLGFEATGATHLVNNFIYFDRDGRSAQSGAPLQVAQLILRENIRLGALRFDNTLAFQQPNRSDVLHLPKWFTKNSLYFSGRVFKKRMLLETGVDFRTNAAFQPDGYQPLTWQFYLQDSTANSQPYLWLDFFASFKVSTFRVFFRYENLSGLWDDRTAFYQTLRYPQPLPAFRLGIRWRFSDSNQPDPTQNTGGNQPPPGVGGGGGRPRF